MTQSFQFDATDRSIIEMLRANGRATNQQIADDLGLSSSTVSSRIRRLEDANQLRVVAVADFAAHDLNFLLRIAVEVDGRPASEVARDLAELPEVFAVHLLTGRYDIDMLVALPDYEGLSDLLLEKFSAIPGVNSLSPSIVVDIMKYQFDVAPIEART